MKLQFDAVVVGLGVMGSAVTRSLAERGLRTLGLDRYESPHALGSSHGRARMIREAYFEHPLYVPLVRRAYELWEALERARGERLLFTHGGLVIGPPDWSLVPGALESCREHDIDAPTLDAVELTRRFPAMRAEPGTAAVLEPRAGFLAPASCLNALLHEARGLGAELRRETVTSWSAGPSGVRVTTDSGDYGARALVLAAGPWTQGLVPDVPLPLTVERTVQLAFEPRGDAGLFAPERCPVFVWEYEPGRVWYGFPAIEGAVKVGLHGGTAVSDPEAVSREVDEEEVELMRGFLRERLPGADGPLVEADVCFYTTTSDGHFLVDFHPTHPEVLIVSPCSGHGFKFAPAIGEIAADLITSDTSELDLAPFRLDRFAG